MRPERDQEPSPSASAARRERQLRVISRQPLEAAFQAALARSLRRHAPGLDERRLARIQEQAFREFLSLVGRKGKSLRGISKRDFLAELERTHAQVLREREEARRELGKLHLRAEVVRRLQAEQEAPQGSSPLQGGLAELFVRARRGELDLEDLEEEVELAASRYASLDKERALTEYERQIELFERRIAKLNASLKQSEETIEDLARRKDADAGLSSIYRTVQGLSPEDGHRGAKLELLVKLFEANLALREQCAVKAVPAAQAASDPI